MAESNVELETATAEPAHPSLRALCETRQGELQEALARLGDDGSARTRQDIQSALDALDGLLTGNLDQIPPMVALQLSRWIASSKYLGAQETRERGAANAVATDAVAAPAVLAEAAPAPKVPVPNFP